VFAAMDEGYRRAARHWGFICNGCEDNCCRSLFFQHTFVEYFFVQSGYRLLDSQTQRNVKARAEATCQKGLAAYGPDRSVHPMCPLNVDSRCLLYAYRPMICRLHGIPHEFKTPGGERMTGAGCDAFYRDCPQQGPFRFDRSGFYQQMAALEKDFRLAAGIQQQIKMTVAQMICSF